MGDWIWKTAGAVAAVAAAGVVVTLAEKLMEKRKQEIDQIVETAIQDSKEENAAPQQAAEVPVEETTEASVQEPQRPVGEDTPNANPFDAKPIETPRTADGKIDVSKLCDPEDFQDWDQLGCQC